MKSKVDLQLVFPRMLLLLIQACLQSDIPYEKAIVLYGKFKTLVNKEILENL